MVAKLKNTIAEQLNAAQVAISNTLADGEIAALVAEYGYDTARLEEGPSLHQLAVKAVDGQTAAEGAQKVATAKVKGTSVKARGAYQALAQVARALFEEKGEELTTLGLTGPMPRTTAGFLTSAYTLFDNALGVESVKTALSGYGYSEDKLQSERATVAALDQVNQAAASRHRSGAELHANAGGRLEGDAGLAGAVCEDCPSSSARQEAAPGEAGHRRPDNQDGRPASRAEKGRSHPRSEESPDGVEKVNTKKVYGLRLSVDRQL